MGAKGYVNPYGNYIPRASVKFVEWAEQARWDDVWAVQRVIAKFDMIITEGHPALRAPMLFQGACGGGRASCG